MRKTLFYPALAGTLCLATCLKADVVTEGFEDGSFSPFSTLGGALLLDSGFGSGPYQGNLQAGLTNVGGRAGGPFEDDVVEFALGLSSGSLDTLAGADATVGAAMVGDFAAQQGDSLAFALNFLTNEATPDPSFNDFGFFSVVDSSGNTLNLSLVADTNSPFVPSSAASPIFGSFAQETGYFTVAFTAPADDTYSIGFGVMNVTDSFTSSAMLVDSVPEPSCVALAGLLAAGGLVWWRRRRP